MNLYQSFITKKKMFKNFSPPNMTSFPVLAEEKHPHSIQMPPCFTGGLFRNVQIVSITVKLQIIHSELWISAAPPELPWLLLWFMLSLLIFVSLQLSHNLSIEILNNLTLLWIFHKLTWLAWCGRNDAIHKLHVYWDCLCSLYSNHQNTLNFVVIMQQNVKNKAPV